MSTASEFLKGLRDAAVVAAPGLRNFGQDVRAELGRLATQGQMELASGLFQGNAFVPYGPGQYTADPTPQVEMPQHEMGGRGR